ncbi:hypothetical protein L249_2503 [Ophiocordyceps polyrhachis-furcata BCC 54312]|uniref:Oxo-4-hydroxy-4-carboxy-5-ureidoimidazoline decarboxylase domain-containing protein n=1 Tax=Ophiocordyceps polyrhachis-furcata BCC 54312 TaxID=1330021 RepID=A0A367LN03_9HYPO|nr:hypothetical protein L249_2503 [Ophiocordyceps polyrhachis-furcata BCC 54312]
MATAQLPAINDLRSCSEPEQTAALDLLFEPSAAIHAILLPVMRNEDFSSYADLIAACHRCLLSLADNDPGERLMAVVGSHPRLGATKIDSAQSIAEQASLGDGDDTAGQLAALNAEYELRFPGLRYVVFVNGRPRPDIMRDMRARIDRGDYACEVDAALQAMCDIARDRAAKLPVRAPRT